MSRVPAYQLFLAELKRRRVFRAAAGYGAGAFVVLQVADLLAEGLRLPPAFLTAATVLALVGFPFALVLAWLFERAPGGDLRRTTHATRSEIEGIVGEPPLRRWAAGAVALAGAGLLFWGVWLTVGASGSPGITREGDFPEASRPADSPALDPSPSVAVLPLRDIGGDPTNEYFSEGMTDDIITHLARIGDLRVISRTSVMPYKGTEKPLRQIAEELGAGALLEGSVRRAGGRVRIVARLVDASTDASLWADTYDRSLDDVFAIQSEVAERIAEALKATLSPAARERIASRPTEDSGAYDLYLRGRYFWNRRSVSDLERAITFFEAAIARDSTFAHAWSGLADTYMMLPFYSPAPPREWVPRARSAAERALALNPELAEARTTLAYALALHDWEWEAADREFRRAQAISPSYATAYKWHSDVLSIMGRPEEALAAAERALALDPLSPNVRTIVGLKHWYAGDEEAALEHFERALDLDPGFPLTLEYVSQIYWSRGDTARFFAARERLDDASGRAGVPAAELRRVLTLGGPEAVLRVQVGAPDAGRLPTERARWHVLLGDFDAALDDLDQAFEERTIWLPFVTVQPDLAPLRADPRYRRVAERLGLE